MGRFLVLVPLMVVSVLAAQNSSPSITSNPASPVTFNKDVLPILQRDCQVCHRPGETAPMSFLSYESTRPWAKAIKQAVMSKSMPPWFADPQFGDYRNEPRLTAADIQTLVTWADTGAMKGNDEDRPAPLEWVEGWRIKPDVIVSMPELHSVAMKGKGEVKGFVIKSPFKQDTWVTSIEIRPGDSSVVHHAVVQTERPENSGFVPGVMGSTPPFVASAGSAPVFRPRSGKSGGRSYGEDSGSFAAMEAVYFPGAAPMDFRPYNAAKLIRGGSDLRIEMHYTPNGTPTTDQTRIGFTVAKTPPRRQFVTIAPTTMVDPRSFRIPAGESNWESSGELTFAAKAELVWFMPHMHLRGKDMIYRLVYPNGRSETVLSAKFDFYWQLAYDVEEPIPAPKGTRMIVVAHYDNSANNRHNPDPTQDVEFGELTSQEMMVPWFGVIVDRDVDPEKIVAIRSVGTPVPNRAISPLMSRTHSGPK